MTSATTIILVLYFIQGSLGHGLRQSPVVGVAGGHAVDIQHAPFMVAVMHFNTFTNEPYFWCGGSIIHEQFVLTSGFCTEVFVYQYFVRVGSTRYDEGGKLHRVENYFRHESYSFEPMYSNNVALLKLSEPVTFGPSVSWIKLADASVNIPIGLAANVTGWGYTQDELSLELQQAPVTVSPRGDCNNYYNSSGRQLTDKQVCVNNNAKGDCLDGEGAPLTVGDLQIGINSFSASSAGEPGICEMVAPHLQWIRNKIKQNL